MCIFKLVLRGVRDSSLRSHITEHAECSEYLMPLHTSSYFGYIIHIGCFALFRYFIRRHPLKGYSYRQTATKLSASSVKTYGIEHQLILRVPAVLTRFVFTKTPSIPNLLNS